MKIVGAMWAYTVNYLVIDCHCGERFQHRADRWRPRCPSCGTVGHLSKLRAEYAQ